MSVPDERSLKEIEKAAIRLARGAGSIVLQYFGAEFDVKFKSKGKTNPVTTADKKSEAYLMEEICTAYPDHAIVGEEGARVRRRQADFTWVLDPLDGTTNFMNRLPIFAVSVGVLFRGEPVVGAIFLPSVKSTRGAMYHGRRGNGAYLNGQRVHVHGNEELSARGLVSLPGNHHRIFTFDGPLKRYPGEVRMSGSIAYEMALTASGSFHYCIMLAPKIWDVAAGVLLVREAGGSILARRKRSRTWTPLQHFGPNASTQAATIRQLAHWHASLIIGVPKVVELVSSSLKPIPRRKRRSGT